MDINELINQNELHMAQLLSAELSELGFPAETLRILKGRGVTTLKGLCSLSRQDLLKTRFLGRGNADRIEEILASMDLKLKT